MKFIWQFILLFLSFVALLDGEKEKAIRLTSFLNFYGVVISFESSSHTVAIDTKSSVFWMVSSRCKVEACNDVAKVRQSFTSKGDLDYRSPSGTLTGVVITKDTCIDRLHVPHCSFGLVVNVTIPFDKACSGVLGIGYENDSKIVSSSEEIPQIDGILEQAKSRVITLVLSDYPHMILDPAGGSSECTGMVPLNKEEHSENQGIRFKLDSLSPSISGNKEALDILAERIGATFNATTNLYTINCNAASNLPIVPGYEIDILNIKKNVHGIENECRLLFEINPSIEKNVIHLGKPAMEGKCVELDHEKRRVRIGIPLSKTSENDVKYAALVISFILVLLFVVLMCLPDLYMSLRNSISCCWRTVTCWITSLRTKWTTRDRNAEPTTTAPLAKS